MAMIAGRGWGVGCVGFVAFAVGGAACGSKGSGAGDVAAAGTGAGAPTVVSASSAPSGSDAALATAAPAADAGAAAAPVAALLPSEKHLADLRQLTFGGENAEAYWSFDGTQLILQARHGDAACDRIFRMPIGASGAPTPVPVSSGEGATTCSYFLPGDQEVIYASTHLGGPECPPKPDRSKGYTWALYESYDIFKAKPDGSNVTRLTTTPGYDAEATVCPKDGTIVFTSTRDGDIDLYKMDANGGNVVRLTNIVGYDGGAFFDADCRHLVWRASRPHPGKELSDYQALLAEHLVRPSKLEIWVGNADGTDQRQITYLSAASFGPFFLPAREGAGADAVERIIFSSNHGDPKGREFDLWAVDSDGTDLERITYADGFDGFPMFSPDGKTLAFASNRATAPGAHDTNVFLAKWVDGPPVEVEVSAADRAAADVAWLADPAREGRGLGTAGLEAAGGYIEARFKDLGLAPAGDGEGFRQGFKAVTDIARADGAVFKLDGKVVAPEDYVVLGFSPAKVAVAGDVVAVGWGIVASEQGVDDYGGLDVKGKVVLVKRFVPERPELATPELERRLGDPRYKAWVARERGAVGVIVVDDPPAPEGGKEAKAEAALPAMAAPGYGDAGIPVVVMKRDAARAMTARLGKKGRVRAEVAFELTRTETEAFNVVGRVVAAPASGKKLPGVVVIGAHYDHLGFGGEGSLAPESKAAHLGADDNASGTAALMEVARVLTAKKAELARDVVIVAFSGEERGTIGSGHFVGAWAEKEAAAAAPGSAASSGSGKVQGIVAMLNMDMVGRMRENRLQVFGVGTASEWPELVGAACDAARIECGGLDKGSVTDGFGPSDQTPFYAAGVPVVHLFTGSHGDYHKPSDTPDKINAAGIGAVAAMCASLAGALATREGGLTLQAAAAGPASLRGDRRSFNASLGTIPNYAGPGAGKKGVLLDGVRTGGAAEKAGMRRGDILVKLGASAISGVEDLMFVLNSHKPGETVSAVIVRDGAELTVEVTFQEGHRPK